MKKELLEYYKNWTGRLFNLLIILGGAVAGLFLKGLGRPAILLLFIGGLLIGLVSLIFFIYFEIKLRKELNI